MNDPAVLHAARKLAFIHEAGIILNRLEAITFEEMREAMDGTNITTRGVAIELGDALVVALDQYREALEGAADGD